jgi:probable phosphoglycerate mutase
MELVLIRHGEPEWVVDGHNRNDPVLTARGRAQADRAAARIADPEAEPADGPIDHLLVSPARRAQETAEPIAARTGIAPVTHDWLLELQMPDAWDDSPIEVVQETFAQQRDMPREQWWDGLPGAESLHDFHDRVCRGAEAVLADLGVTPTEEHGLWQVADGAPERVVAVAHGGTNSTLVAHLLGVEKEPWDWERFRMGHASVAVLTTTPLAGADIWSLRGLGDAGHLPRPDRTA